MRLHHPAGSGDTSVSTAGPGPDSPVGSRGTGWSTAPSGPGSTTPQASPACTLGQKSTVSPTPAAVAPTHAGRSPWPHKMKHSPQRVGFGAASETWSLFPHSNSLSPPPVCHSLVAARHQSSFQTSCGCQEQRWAKRNLRSRAAAFDWSFQMELKSQGLTSCSVHVQKQCCFCWRVVGD